MNILYICHRFPFPPKRGGKIRPFNMIRHLTASGHRVTVCSLARSPQEAEEGRGIAPHCARFEMGQVSDPVQTLRMVARLPLPSRLPLSLPTRQRTGRARSAQRVVGGRHPPRLRRPLRDVQQLDARQPQGGHDARADRARVQLAAVE